MLPLALQANDLHQAVRARDLITLESLLNTATQDEVNATVKNGVTPLHIASAADFYAAAKLLIEHGAAVNARTASGFTPLHWAASKNAVDSIEILLANGADVNAKAKSGITPLHWAASKDATDAAKLLLEAGADINAKTALGYTPLHLAVKKNPYSATAVLLAKTQADIEDQAGFLNVEELPDDSSSVSNTPANDIEKQQQDLPTHPKVNRALPGTFLEVPLGLQATLEFVWIETLKLWFQKHEVTNRQYRKFRLDHTSRSFEGLNLDLPEQPVVYVSWNDAQAFCDWLNKNYSDRIPANSEFRLPTAYEWEFVAACGDERRYPWGNQWPPLYGNFSDMTARKNISQWNGILGYDDGYTVTCLVKDSGMNEWGIYGLAGNVWEWCNDWFDNADRKFKIRKGGSWDFDPRSSLTVTAKGLDRPDAKYDTIGFRVVVAPKQAQPKPKH
jgi:hypothetical protein